MTTIEVPRPCRAVDLVEVAPPYKGGWGPPLSYDPVPWEECGAVLGFDGPFVVRTDQDSPIFEPDRQLGIALRYLIVPTGGTWELRAGRTQLPAVEAGTGGSHRHMFSANEYESATAEAKQVLSGYIYRITLDAVVIS